MIIEKQKDNSKNISSSIEKIEENEEVGSFYRCSPYLPLQIDDAIWGMSEDEFEEYTGIPLVADQEQTTQSGLVTLYDIHFLHTDIESLELEDGESYIVSEDGYGILCLGYEAWLQDFSANVDVLDEYKERMYTAPLTESRWVNGMEIYPGQTEKTGSLLYGDSKSVNVMYYSKDWILSNAEEMSQILGDSEILDFLLDICRES